MVLEGEGRKTYHRHMLGRQIRSVSCLDDQPTDTSE